MYLDRREFLSLTTVAAAGVALGAGAEARDGMPYRKLGNTGEEVSLLGLGGYHIGVDALSDAESVTLMRTAMDAGVNFLDNAWDYTQGRSERLMGKALKDGYRDKAFLMTKGIERTPEGVQRQIDESLQRLDLDVIDLWQFHGLTSVEDARQVCEELLPIAIKAREAGKIRYIGFTGHVTPASHLEALKYEFDWAAVQMPMSVFDYHYESFQQQVLPKASEKQVGVVAMKTLTGAAAPHKQGVATVQEMWRYSMSLPVSTVVTGIDSMEKLHEALALVKGFTPLAEPEKQALLQRAETQGKTGEFESFKV